MSCNCSHCHDKKIDRRDGTGRLNRLLHALDPKNVPLDDRKLEDLLLFIKEYAAKIRFVQLPDEDDESWVTWQTFFEQDMAVMLSAVLSTDISKEKVQYDTLRKELYKEPTVERLLAMFEPIFELKDKIETWYEQATDDNPIQKDLALIIQSNLSDQLQQLLSYRLAVNDKTENVNSFQIKTTSIWGFDASHLDPNDSFFDTPPSVLEFDDPTSTADDIDPLVLASFYLDDIFQAFDKAVSDIVAKSPEYLDFALMSYPHHQPHMALYIAFLELFKYLQDDLNDITGRHLEFFYRDVLHLSERPAQADSVHVIFELAKGVNSYIVEGKTPLLAGKDVLNKDIIYKTGSQSEDRSIFSIPFVPNKAVIKEIKSIFIEHDKDTKKQFLALHANPVANSTDGLGAAFNQPNSSFDTFGVGGRDEETKLTLCNFKQQNTNLLNKGRMGFAIASPQLLLAGGLRTIELKIKGLEDILSKVATISGTTTIDKATLNNILEIWLSAEKGWLNPPFEVIPTASSTTLRITLPVGEQKIIPFDVKIHQGDAFATNSPVLKVVVKNLDPQNFTNKTPPQYENLVIDGSFSLKTTVGDSYITPVPASPDPTNGLKELIIQNAQQRLENGKPFLAFTSMPSIGAPLYIGSKEFSSKKIAKYKVSLRWQGTASPTLNLKNLSNKKWEDAKATLTHIPSTTPNTSLFSSLAPTLPSTIVLERNFNLTVNEFTSNTENGFLKIVLADATPATIEAIAKKGIELQAEFASIEYESELKHKDLMPGIDQFFHLYPYGVVETFPAKNFGEILEMDRLTGGLFVNTQVPDTSTNPSWYLLPQFNFGQPLNRVLLANESQQYNQNPNERQKGHLFIGIESLVPPQNLSLLFKFEEGTQADDEGTAPSVHWSYLTQNEWRPLPNNNILTDSTFGLQTTGIMLFDIPKEISIIHTLMPAGLHWLCASVTDNPDRFPHLMGITAQATTATFIDQENHPSHYDTPLKHGSIARLKNQVDSVKGVSQPYESFGGRPADKGIAFYMEASERIRHKGRAVTIWDYEHLVLSQFSDVFKVKALPTSDPDCICRKHDKPSLCENAEQHKNHAKQCGEQIAPRNVMVVPIPDFRYRVGGNRLQPKNSNRVLLEIQRYLSRRTSPFVKVHVKNPKYEEVLTAFRVQFIEGIDKGTFMKRLNEEIVQYLTPWAFKEGEDVLFDGRVYASDVINFIEERSYVDFITDFRMFHCKENCSTPQDSELFEISGIINPTSASGTLTSPTRNSLIEIMGTGIQLMDDEQGKYKILLADGDHILIKKEGYGTKIYRFDFDKKLKTGKLVDYVNSTVKISLALNSDGTIYENGNITLEIQPTTTPIVPPTIVLNDAFTPTTTLNNIEYKQNDGTYKSTPPNGTLKFNEVVTIKATIPAAGSTPEIKYSEKTIIIGNQTCTVTLYPLSIKPLKITVKIADTTTDIDKVDIYNINDSSKKAVEKITGTGATTVISYEFTDINMGSIIIVSKEGFMPRPILLSEYLFNDGKPELEIELVPNCLHKLENTDELIEFWEKVLETYFPSVRGMELSIRASTSRSILVSAEQHWIDLYEAPPVEDVCAIDATGTNTATTSSVKPSSSSTPNITVPTPVSVPLNVGAQREKPYWVNRPPYYRPEQILRDQYIKKYQIEQSIPYIKETWNWEGSNIGSVFGTKPDTVFNPGRGFNNPLENPSDSFNKEFGGNVLFSRLGTEILVDVLKDITVNFDRVNIADITNRFSGGFR
jgi:hypothetical protein